MLEWVHSGVSVEADTWNYDDAARKSSSQYVVSAPDRLLVASEGF